MGMRREIVLDYGTNEETKTEQKIHLYTHWGAEGLEQTLAASLERARDRWDDDMYLPRIIFTDMTKDTGDELTGYGLAPFEMGPDYPSLEVDLENKTVNKVPFEDFIKNPQMFAI